MFFLGVFGVLGGYFNRFIQQVLHLLYSCYVFWRNCFFDIGLLRTRKVDLPVVSVGNIVAGGVGKTSLVYKIASDLGIPVGILSRGYLARVKVQSKEVSSPEEGDEAYMLAQKLPFAKVVVGKDRVQSAESLRDVRYILLDDGMQHRYIHRDVEIVILHASDLFGGGSYLPKGRLRDSPRRLKEADWIFVHGGPCDIGQIRRYTNAPIIETRYTIINRDELEGRRVGAFCGIGKPAPFFQMLEELRSEVVLKKILPDHSPFVGVEKFIQETRSCGGECVVCTEKDYVKLQYKEGVIPLLVTMEIVRGQEEYEKLKRHLEICV